MMKLFAFHCGKERTLRSILDPFDDDCGSIIEPPYFFYMVQHPEQTLLFDTGAHVSFIDDPATRLGAGADLYDIVMEPGEDVVSRLDSAGVKPESVGHIVQSHLHYDHAGGLEFFPDADVYVQKAELPFAQNPPIYQRAEYVPADFEHPINWKHLDGEYDVFNDGRVIIFPTPGHTPGHQSLLVKLKEKNYILVGDAAYDPTKMKERRLPGFLWNPDALISSWERIEELQRENDAELIFTHDLHFHGKTRLAPEEWYE